MSFPDGWEGLCAVSQVRRYFLLVGLSLILLVTHLASSIPLGGTTTNLQYGATWLPGSLGSALDRAQLRQPRSPLGSDDMAVTTFLTPTMVMKIIFLYGPRFAAVKPVSPLCLVTI